MSYELQTIHINYRNVGLQKTWYFPTSHSMAYKYQISNVLDCIMLGYLILKITI